MYAIDALQDLAVDLVRKFDLVHIRLFMFIVEEPGLLLRNVVSMLSMLVSVLAIGVCVAAIGVLGLLRKLTICVCIYNYGLTDAKCERTGRLAAVGEM